LAQAKVSTPSSISISGSGGGISSRVGGPVEALVGVSDTVSVSSSGGNFQKKIDLLSFEEAMAVPAVDDQRMYSILSLITTLNATAWLSAQLEVMAMLVI
jgi:hypothetical protein